MKQRWSNWLRCITLVSAMLIAGPNASAQEQDDGDAFQLGGSCAALAYVSGPSLNSLITSGYSDDFHSFCYPEEPADCSEYTSFLKGVGRLATGDDGYHCSLIVP